jgi:hypothetical protein
MKRTFFAILLACVYYSSFGQIPEGYLPDDLEIFDTDTIKYQGNADGYIDVKSIPRPDCEAFAQLANYYYFSAEKAFVVPEGIQGNSDFERMKNNYSRSYKNSVFKKESELNEADFQKVLVLYAPIHCYKDWDRFNLPIIQEENGFSFRGQEYTDVNDGIFYVSSDAIVKTGNSITPVLNLFNSYGILYKYLIINNNSYVKYGLLNGHEIDLDKIRKSNYESSETTYYKFDVTKSLRMNCAEYDEIVEQICETMDLDIPDFKIHCMVHSEPNEARLFSNWFFLLGCDPLAESAIFGANINGIIHVIGEDRGLVSHESFHAVWDALVGIRNVFFTEGIQMYYEFLCDSSKISPALEVMKKYRTYDLKPLIAGDEFWNTPIENNRIIAYPISGLFSMYLIEKYGLEKFKSLYRARKGEEGFTDVYHVKYDDLLTGYYSWIDSK